MSVLRTAVLIVIFVVGVVGLVTAARLFPRLLAHAQVTWPAAPSRRLARRAPRGSRSTGLGGSARRPPDRHDAGTASPSPNRRDPMSGPPT